MKLPRFLKPRALWLWFEVGLAVLLVVSFVPLAWKVEWGLHGARHFRVHVVVFAIMCTVASLTALSFQEKLTRWLALVLIGLESELLQSKFYAIPLEWPDLKADAWGLFIAFLMTELLRQWRPSPVLLRQFLRSIKESVRGNSDRGRAPRV